VHSIIVIGPVLLVVAVAIAVIVPTLVGRYLPDQHRQGLLKSTTATGGTLVSPFMLVLGFMVVVLWGQLNEAQKAIERESVALGDIAVLADSLPQSVGQPVRDEVIAYATAAVAEWQALGNGAPSAEAVNAFHALRDAVLALPRQATDSADATLSDKAVDQMLAAQGYRSDRISAATSDIQGILWLALIAGTILYIAFIALTDTGPLRSRIVMMFLAIAVVALILMLIAMLDNPFSGDVQADPAPFTNLVRDLTTTP
jgi:cytochrome c biogenesis factor